MGKRVSGNSSGFGHEDADHMYDGCVRFIERLIGFHKLKAHSLFTPRTVREGLSGDQRHLMSDAVGRVECLIDAASFNERVGTKTFFRSARGFLAAMRFCFSIGRASSVH